MKKFGSKLKVTHNNLSYMDGLYQSMIRNNKVIFRGSRDPRIRFKYLKPHFEYEKCKSFLDLGCNIGEFCNYVSGLGAEKVLGIEYNDENLKFAKRAKGNFVKEDLRNIDSIQILVNQFFGNNVIDVVFACSIYIEMDGKFWDLVNSLNWRICYVESNPIHKCQSLLTEVHQQSYHVEELATYDDPTTKKIWRLTSGK